MTSSFNEFSNQEKVDFRPWELPDVSPGPGLERSRVIDESLEIIPRMTVEEIQAMQQQAYEESLSQGKKDGYKKGYEDGYQAGQQLGYDTGLAEGHETIKNTAKELTNLLQSLDEPFKVLDHQVEEELIALAVAIAKQIIRRELKIDSGQVVSVVREALQILPASARRISLYLHPEDAKLVRSALSLDTDAPEWKIVEDPVLTRGGCRVDSDSSRIDATIEKRLAAVIASVFGGERGNDSAQRVPS